MLNDFHAQQALLDTVSSLNSIPFSTLKVVFESARADITVVKKLLKEGFLFEILSIYTSM
jgi:hypothetical protein